VLADSSAAFDFRHVNGGLYALDPTLAFTGFGDTLGHKELPKLEQAGIAFRVDVPGARIVDGRLEANVATPGLGIEYRDEAGDFVPYDPAAPPSLGATEVRAVTASGRAGRAVSVP
jgi:hexosaminidase